MTGEPVAAGAGMPPDTAVADLADLPDPNAVADASLIELVGRLSTLLAESDLAELEISAGGTSLVLRKPAEPTSPVPVAAPQVVPGDPAPAATPAPTSAGPAAPARSAALAAQAAPAAPAPASAGHSGRLVVAAPLTGVWYASQTPGAPPFVSVGSTVTVGQIIGLIEAMKLFNEIKSDRAGRVARIVPENGALVRAKQPLIEVEPL